MNIDMYLLDKEHVDIMTEDLQIFLHCAKQPYHLQIFLRHGSDEWPL